MTKQTFLVEIGTEELPPKDLRLLAESFATNFAAELERANLKYKSISWFATPRRLALKVTNLTETQMDYIAEKRGPAISQVFTVSGKPNKAAERWAYSCGITVDQAERLVTDKGEWLVYRTLLKGLPVQQLITNMVSAALSRLPIQKLMCWSDPTVQFVRPVHTVILLLGTELIPGSILGVESARTIRGHRFMGETEFTLDNANDYPQILLERGKVIADYEVRKALIKRDVEQEAAKLGGKADINESLLEAVTSLVEWPVVLSAKFDAEFLSVPVEALVHIMKDTQKYFPVYDNIGNLLSRFILVANIQSKEPQQIITGNEKVLRSRLADAQFFFNSDRKRCLEDNLPQLKNVLFQQQLGNLQDKTNRVKGLAGWIASKIGANISQATRAGLLSKCDIMTNMVFEFPETQGIMGMHYARYNGEVEDVAIALSEQYQPRFSGDRLPTSLVSCSLAIADKMDTLVGIFGVGQRPKGDKDPFALRRAALGILRIIIENKLPLDLQILTEEAVYLYSSKLTNHKVVNEIVEFMLGRFLAWYQGEGYSLDIIQAVLACRPTKPADFDARVKALSYFCTLVEAVPLVAANKRISNILAKSKGALKSHVDTAILVDKHEIQLANHLIELRDKLESHIIAYNYQQVLIELATLRDPVNDFFENVRVMVEVNKVRINRLTLLNKLRELFLLVADISILQL